MSCHASYRPSHSNPFASEYVDRVPYSFSSIEWERHLHRLAQLRFRAAVIGPEGSGKTTLLSQLMKQLRHSRQTAWLRIDRDPGLHPEQIDRAISWSGQGGVVLIDSLEQLSFWNRRCLIRTIGSSPGGLIATCHRPPTQLPVWIRCRPTTRDLRHVLEHLPMPLDSVIWNEAIRAFQKHQGNVRDTLWELYDRFAEGHIPLREVNAS